MSWEEGTTIRRKKCVKYAPSGSDNENRLRNTALK